MPPVPQEEPENVELDAIAANGVEANDRLENLQDIGEASLVQQNEAVEAIRDLEGPLEAIALNTAPDTIHKVSIVGLEASVDGDDPIEDREAAQALLSLYKANRGPKGYTPLKGTDYYTDEEKQELVAEILPRATPVKGKDYYTPEEQEELTSFILSAATPVKNVDYFDGKPGYTPRKNIDYFDGKPGKNADEVDVESIIQTVTSRIPKPKPGQPGKNGSPDTGEQIVEKITGLLPYSALKDAPQFRSQASRDYDLSELKDVSITNPSTNQVLKWDGTRWVNGTGGGGAGVVETIVAGTGITVDDTDPANPIVAATASAPAFADITGDPYDNAALEIALDAKQDVLTGLTASVAELNFTDGVTSNIQTQLDAKGTFTLPSLTAGSVLFSNGTTIAQDNANFFWDDTNNRLGIGTATPSTPLHVAGVLTVDGGAVSSPAIFNSSSINSYLQVNNSGGNGLWFGQETASAFVSVIRNLPLQLRTNNTTQMTILGNGNIGIGVSPSGRLHVLGQGAAYSDNVFRVDNSASGRIITVTGDGRVFIGGQNGNDVVLSVDKTGAKTTGNIAYFADSGGNILLNSNSMVTTNANFSFGSNSFGSALEFIAPANNGMIRISGANTTIGQQSQAGTPDKTLRVWNSVATTGVTSFRVREGAGQSTSEAFGVYANNDSTARLVVKDGNVGIGIASPGNKLVVAGASTDTTVIHLDSGGHAYYQLDAGDNTYEALMRFMDGGTTRFAVGLDNDTAHTNFYIGDNALSNKWLTITNAGNVGIGTTAPDKKLEINLGTTDALRLTYNDANGSAATYMDTTLASDGGVTFTGVGSAPDFTFAQDVSVPDEAYGAGWNGSLEVPTKNAVYDKIEAIPALTDGDKGDITVSSSGAVWTVDNGAISLAKTSAGVQASLALADSALQSAAIGVSVQAYDADLTTWAGITPGTGVGTFLATPSSANLRAALTDETGTGVAVFGTAPTFTTNITTPSVLASANDSGALGASGTAFSDLFLASGGVINWNAGNATLTHSASLLTSNVNIKAPDIGLLENNASPAQYLLLSNGDTDLTADRTLTLTVNNADRTISLAGNVTLAGALITSGANSLTLTTTGATNVTLPTTGTLSTLAGAETITNKRPQPRTASSTTASNLSPDLAIANVYYRTTQTATLTVDAPTGTPVIGEVIVGYISAASGQTLNMNAAYVPFGAAFPASLTAGKTFMFTAQYNGSNWPTLWAVAV